MKKKILASALALVMCLGLAPMASAAEPQVIWLDYDKVNFFHEGLAVVEKDGKCGYIDKTGKEVIPVKYGDARDFSDGLAIVALDGGKKTGPGGIPIEIKKWGFIDKTGREVVPCIYDFAFGFSEGFAAVEKDGKYGFVDTTGKVVIPLQYDYATNFSEGLVEVKKDGKWGFIDKTGKVVVPCQYDFVESFHEGMAMVERDGKYGFVDTTGKVVVPCQYDFVRDFREGLAAVEKDGKYGFIDKAGNVVIAMEYDSANYFAEGLAYVKKDDKCGFIDKTGKVVVPLEYDYVCQFREGRALVSKGEDPNAKYGFIDATGKVVIPLEYSAANEFYDGVAWVRTGDEEDEGFFIDKTGKQVEYHGLYSPGATNPPDKDVELVQENGIYGAYGRYGIKITSNAPTNTSYTETLSSGVTISNFIGKETKTVPFYGSKWVDSGHGTSVTVETKEEKTITIYYIDPENNTRFSFPSGWSHYVSFYRLLDDGVYQLMFGYSTDRLTDESWNANLKYYEDSTIAKVTVMKPNEYMNAAETVYIQKYTGAAATTPAQLAYPSTQEVEVDGKKVTFQCYALKDANGNDTNYIKLRDLADILNGSAAQFQVGWDGNITITTGKSYTKNGTEQNTPFSGNRQYEKTGVTTLVNGSAAELDTFQLKDDNGGGYTYYKLRDLGAALGITVDWSAERGIFIETT